MPATIVSVSNFNAPTFAILNGDEVVIAPDVVMFGTSAIYNFATGISETSLTNFGTLIGFGSTGVVLMGSDTSTLVNHGTISNPEGGNSLAGAILLLGGQDGGSVARSNYHQHRFN